MHFQWCWSQELANIKTSVDDSYDFEIVYLCVHHEIMKKNQRFRRPKDRTTVSGRVIIYVSMSIYNSNRNNAKKCSQAQVQLFACFWAWIWCGKFNATKKKKKKRPLCQGSCTDIYNLLRCSQVLRTNPVLNNQVISILGTW